MAGFGHPHFRLNKGTRVPQATVWPIVRPHCLNPGCVSRLARDRRYCLSEASTAAPLTSQGSHIPARRCTHKLESH